MADGTNIEWTTPPGVTRGATWNMVGGCEKVSPACKNCWAMRDTARFALNPATPRFKGLAVFGQGGPRWTGEVRLFEDLVDLPLRWQASRGIFVCSKSDLFHDVVPNPFIDLVWSTMLLAPQHIYFVLTKRPARMLQYLTAPDLYQRVLRAADQIRHQRPRLTSVGISDPGRFPARGIWLGVTAEDQRTANERVPLLLQCPAAVRWLSYEPALSAVDWSHAVGEPYEDAWDEVSAEESVSGEGEPEDVVEECEAEGDWLNYGRNLIYNPEHREWLRARRERAQFLTFKRGIDWIVCGGESGPGARPFDLAWARDTIRQCKAAGVPVFVKQLGLYAVHGLREDMVGEHPTREGAPSTARAWERGDYGERLKLRDRKGGDMDEWPADLRVREWPEVQRG